MSDPSSPCLACGACCAAFRVAFYWAEPVPAALTERLDPHRAVMRGTRADPVRCVALEGTVGQATRCAIYDDRPSPCRELAPSTPQAGNPQCDAARARYGLPPLAPGGGGGAPMSHVALDSAPLDRRR